VYFFWYHFLLNLCLQNGQRFELAWWLLRQLEYLNMCRHSSSLFILRYRGFVFLFSIQHHPNSQWFSDLCGSLHLTYLEPWILHENVECPYFQQFLHCSTLGFILVPWIVAMYLPTLKHWLMRPLVLLPLWTSQMSIQMIDISDLGKTLMTLGLDANIMRRFGH